MALAFIYSLWPMSIFQFDDLRESDKLVRKLSIPENTKGFVYAARNPESNSVIYILSTQNLSERSAIDAECLIREVQPDAVVVQVDHSVAAEIESEGSELGNVVGDDVVPTSSLGVIKRCFIDKITKEKYENVAGNLVLRDIFGIGFHGHIFAAKRVAKEVGSSLLMLETPLVKTSLDNPSSDNEVDNPPSDGEVNAGSKIQGLVNSLVPHKVGSVVCSSSQRFYLADDVQLKMVKLICSYMDVSIPKLSPAISISEARFKEIQPGSDFHVPPFAQSIYPLLVDLHNIFSYLPSIGRALALSQKLLYDVNRGEVVDRRIISELYTFRIAVEGLRIALNNAGRLPFKQLGKSTKTEVEFSELSVVDKSYALLAQALQGQTRKFKTVVAVVDASSLAGLRKHWNTPLPPEVKDLVGQLVINCESDGDVSSHTVYKWLFSSKPVVAVGAGATAVLGASSLSKVVPVSTFMKVLTFKIPASVKLILTHTQKTIAIAASNTFGPSKILAPGLAKSGANATAVLKTAASAEKIRTVAHGVIASVEKTSFSAMRSAFYEIMRKRRVQPVGVLPWATFGCSVATCSGLLMYGDGIECAAASLPAAPSIASLGRGIQSLHQASEEVRLMNGTRIQQAIESLMYKLRKVKIQ